MAIRKWSWTTTNPYTYNPGINSTYAHLGATAAETKKAYAALANHGKTIDFSYKVWNDLCAKIYDLNRYWQTNNYFGHTWPAVWMKSPRIEDYPDEWTYEYENGVAGGTKGRITPFMMNMAAGGLIPSAVPPWAKTLGRNDIRKGDICYGSYFLWIADTINHWCDLVPAWWSFRDSFKWNPTRAHPVMVPSLPIPPELMESILEIDFPAVLDDSVPGTILLAMVHNLGADEIVMLPALHVISPLNFYTLNISCKVWDKIIMYLIPEIQAWQLNVKAKPIKLPYKKSGVRDSFYHSSTANAQYGAALGGFGIRFSGQHSSRVKPGFGVSYDFPFEDSFFYDGTGKIRTRRPVPMSALTRHEWHGRVFVEHEGILTMDVEDGFLRFTEQLNQAADTVAAGVHTGGIPVKEYASEIKVFDSKDLTVPHEDIVLHGNEPEGIVGIIQSLDGRGRFKTDKDIAIAGASPDPLSHSGNLQSSSGTIEMTFANEQIMEVRQGGFRVSDGEIEISFRDISDMNHDGLVDTAEDIVLSDAPPLEIETKESVVRTDYSGELSYDGVIEQAADAVISTIVSGELDTSLNAYPEIDVIAATILHAADVGTTRMAKLGAEAEVSTIEKAIVDRVARKLIESSIEVSTRTQAAMIARLIHFLESTIVASTDSSAEAIGRLPKHFSPTSAKVQTNISAFMDASYVRGDSLIADVAIRYGIEAAADVLRNRAAAEAANQIYILQESLMDMSPTKEMLGEAIAEADSDAHIVMAHSVLTLASTIEDELAADEDSILAFDVERTLVFQ